MQIYFPCSLHVLLEYLRFRYCMFHIGCERSGARPNTHTYQSLPRSFPCAGRSRPSLEHRSGHRGPSHSGDDQELHSLRCSAINRYQYQDLKKLLSLDFKTVFKLTINVL